MDPLEPPAESRVELPPSHPAFAGHFPGEPILPGVALLDMVLRALGDTLGAGQRVTGLPSVRWRAVVRPGETLRIRIRSRPGGRLAFEVLSGDTLVSDGSLVVEPARP